MTEKEIIEFLRQEASIFSTTELAERCSLSREGVYGFVNGHNGGAQLRTIICLCTAMGYEVQLVRSKVVVPQMLEPPVVARPVMKRTVSPPITKVKPENEYACLKCGLDAGVVEVHGHLQCARCDHIVQDCCGD